MTLESILLHARAGHASPRTGPAAWALGAAAALGVPLTAAVFDADAFTGGPAEAQRLPRGENQVCSQAATETAARLAGAAAELGVAFRAVTGRSFAYGLPEVVADHGRLHDLIVAGVAREGLLSERGMAEHIVFEAGRPVVIVPAEYRGPFRSTRIMVAWDNSRVAARALGDAMPLLRRAEAVEVVSVGGERAIEGSLAGDAVVEALIRRGISATFGRLEADAAGVGGVLGRHAVDVGADLLVMGAFGHSRLRQFMLGGATRSVLDEPRLPVLLSH